MKENKKDSAKKTWIQYGIFAAIAVVLYTTGLHAEVIGFAQRGILATGLMNPDVKEMTVAENTGSEEAAAVDANKTKADFNFDLIDSDGNTVSLEELKGKVIFMNLWATWCPPCVAEMPSIDELHEEMGDEVAFVMLSLDDDFEKAKSFDKRKGYDLPIYTAANRVPRMYHSSAIPTTYVIDSEGNLVMTHNGMADYSHPDFKEFLNSLK